jgi:hypothetical protein
MLTSPPPIVARDHTRGAEFWADTEHALDATYGSRNWRAAARYIDVFFEPGGARYNRAVRSAGIKTGIYLDPNLCSGAFAIGPNRDAGPDCSILGNEAFYHQDGHPELALTVSTTGTQLQKWGNPASTSLQAAARAWAAKIDREDGGYDVIMIDDASTPEEWWGQYWCWGVGTFAGGNYRCAGHEAKPPFTTAYSRGQWQAGEAALAAALQLPVIFNGLGAFAASESDAAVASVAATGANVWGGMCENCFYGNQANAHNPFVWTGPILDANLTSLMRVIGAGRNAIVINDDVSDRVTRERALADMMLVYDPDHLFVAGRPCGNVSLIHACPEQALTFYAPLGPYPSAPSSVVTATGVYAREFAACYDHGRFVGRCAAVVNPDVDNSRSLPTLTHAYHHTLALHGTGPCNCYGDSGSVTFDGAAAPATLPKATGYVLFP